MPLSNLEYVSLRLVRRYLLSDSVLLRYGAYLPYYRTNRNQSNPATLIDDYSRLLERRGWRASDCRVLEVGVGRTNSTGYEMAARFGLRTLDAFEPFVELSSREDARFLRDVAARYGLEPEVLRRRVRRIADLKALPAAGTDLILSNSVLEHVSDPRALFADFRRLLRPGGAMLHLVDYRDHFFKYPFHFLQFRKSTWDRFLNPGDLPGWRLYDHAEQLEAAGFAVEILESTTDSRAYAAIAPRVSPDYRKDDPRLQTCTAAIWAAVGPT